MPHRRRYRRPPPSQNNTTVYAIAGVVVIGVIALFFIVSSGGSTTDDVPEPQQAQKPTAKPKPDPKKEARNKARWWMDAKFYDDYGKQRVLSGRQIHDLVAEAKEKGFPELLGKTWDERLKKIYERLLKRESNDPDANRALGRIPLSDYPNFFKVFKRMSDEKALDKEFVAVRDKYEDQVLYGPQWRTPAVPREEFERISAALRRYEAFAKEMEANPAKKAIFEAQARIKVDPFLGKYETAHIERPPFVLFYAHKDLTKKNNSAAEQARVQRKREELKGKLESYTQLLQDYLALFRKTWMEPLGLPTFAPDQLFYIWMFDDRKRFDEFGRNIGQAHPPGLLGYFNHRDHWVYLYEPVKERIKVETALAHELTHQLHWHFSKDKGPFANHFLRSKASWFKEGWAEYIGWCRKKKGRFEFLQNAPVRMDVFHHCRKSKLPVYPIRKLIRSESYLHHVRSVGINLFSSRPGLVKNGWLAKELKKRRIELKGVGMAMAVALYLDMLYAEGWLLVKFLYEGEGGKYRDGVLKFTKASLKGYLSYKGARGYAQAHEVFAEIFGLKTNRDWASFQKEFDDFMEAKMYEIPPTKR